MQLDIVGTAWLLAGNASNKHILIAGVEDNKGWATLDIAQIAQRKADQ